MRRSVFVDEHEAFRESLRSLLEGVLKPEATRAHRQPDGGIPRSLWRTLGEHGYLGFMVPEEYGGGGTPDFRFNAVLGEELARHGIAYASAIGINTDVVAPYLLQLTTPEQRERWLPAFCRGDLVTAIGLTEPSGGSDLAALRTTAVPADGGWTLNGSKTFITNGCTADLAIVAARTSDGPRGGNISLFALEAGSPGFTCGPKLDKLGQPEADTAELFFDDAFVPAANQIGETGRGLDYVKERLGVERLSCALVNVAHARRALETTLEYVREREAFGKAVGSYQHNAFVLAELDTAIDVAQSFVDRCLDHHVTLGALDAIDAAKAKYWASETQNRVLEACVQLHGGFGYMRESPVGRAWADARVTTIWAGTSEIMRSMISRSLGLRV